MSVAITVGLLTAAAVYLFMQRGMVRIVLGFVLASHAANLLLFSAGNTAFRDMPYVGAGEPGQQADPLPQAFVLTAIVIAFSITMFMVTLAITTTGDDDTEDQERSPATVLISPPDDEDLASASTQGPKLTTADTDDSIGRRIDTVSTGSEAAGTGGADASPGSPVHDFESPVSPQRGRRT
ncbi:MAG: sodium:proton antiporter [Nesterenkonia sp.]